MQSVDLIIMFVRSGKKRENKAQLRLSSLVNAIFGHRSESINISLLIINYEETFQSFFQKKKKKQQNTFQHIKIIIRFSSSCIGLELNFSLVFFFPFFPLRDTLEANDDDNRKIVERNEKLSKFFEF